MKRTTWTLIVMGLILLPMGWAQAADWTVMTPVGDGQVDVWLTRSSGRAHVGLATTWLDNDDNPADGDAFGLGFLAMYDVVDDAHIVIGDVNIPATWSVGAKGQIMFFTQSSDVDPAPSLFTSLLFGNEKMGLGPVYQYALTDDLWNKLAPQDEHRLLISAYFNF